MFSKGKLMALISVVLITAGAMVISTTMSSCSNEKVVDPAVERADNLRVGLPEQSANEALDAETAEILNQMVEKEYPYKEYIGISVDSVNTLGRVALKADEGGTPVTSGWQLYVHVPFYSQNDPSWSGHGLGFNYCGNSTIGRYGCFLSSMCMVYARWGNYVNPPTLNNWRYGGRSHYAFSTSGCGDLIRIPQATQYPGMSRNYRWISPGAIYRQLQLGRPVIIKVWTGSQIHYMVIFAFDGRVFWVKDPIRNAAGQNRPLYGWFRGALVWGY